jgi:HSP20 family protein
MDLIRWGNGLTRPLLEFESLQDEINRLFDDVGRVTEPRGLFEGTFSPAVDVVEEPDKFEVLCDVPGIEIKDIEISISGSVLTIKGEKRAGGSKRNGGASRQGVVDGKFQRTLQFPLPVDPDHVEAVLKDGVLTIALPKHEELKPRQISVATK